MFVVAFDGSELSRAALYRAREFAATTGDDVLALSVVPGDATYAVDTGWVDSERVFDREAVARDLRKQALEAVPNAYFRAIRADRYANAHAIGKRIRRAAREADADVVFLGSEDAGRVVAPVSSVADEVAEGPAYDVHIVRSTD